MNQAPKSPYQPAFQFKAAEIDHGSDAPKPAPTMMILAWVAMRYSPLEYVDRIKRAGLATPVLRPSGSRPRQSATARTVNGGFAHQIRPISPSISSPLMHSTALVDSR